MAGKRVPINWDAVHRVKKLLNDNGKSQEWLAEQLDLSPVTISRLLTGKHSITDDRAKKIANLFPGTRHEWIMGEDDFQTDEEKLSSMALRNYERADAEVKAFFSSAKAVGFDFVFTPNNKDTDYQIVYDNELVGQISCDRWSQMIDDFLYSTLCLILKDTALTPQFWTKVNGARLKKIGGLNHGKRNIKDHQ